MKRKHKGRADIWIRVIALIATLATIGAVAYVQFSGTGSKLEEAVTNLESGITTPSDSGTEPAPSVEAEETSSSYSGFFPIIDETNPVDKSYFEDAVFIGDSLLNGLKLNSEIGTVADWLVNDVAPKVKFVGDVIVGVIDFVKQLVDWFEPFAEAGNKFCDDLATDFNNLRNDTKQSFEDIAGAIVRNISSAADFVTNAAYVIGNALGFPGLGDYVSSVFQNIATFMENPIQNAYNFIIGIPNAIVSWFLGLGSRISNAIGSIHFPTPHITYWNVSVANWQVPIPYVQWYAKGGIVDSATLIGAGEAGKEAIVPLTEPNLRSTAGRLPKQQ